ncbi:hypothetical protein BMR1_03g04805 [Babesia microti strain RI]|uniref:PITH domain-containing protein n=1 Tax=Babesia microti (strain RI) TaxID=1133968 RepID=A0A1R4ACH7_BABMR|nr:hypothetical protein BMR1_03g04805 [Babesia microti strain RI]SJK86721.1 hypothetical protein BMR1_03g04805 [Babesia microti strain RI]|eukprot:XP_021338844.1 hypothetical protein BMR1_03g04805 [Babesia microti strain RI]
MAKVGNEAINTEKMRKHQLMKYLQQKEHTPREPIDICRETNGVDLVQSTILNASPSYGSLEHVLVNSLSSASAVVSDVDHQMIVKIFFKQPTKVFALTINSQMPPDIADCLPPKIIQVYGDLPEFDFSEVDNTPIGDQTIITDKNLIDRATLKGSKFQRVTSLILFIQENLGKAKLTFINNIVVWGYLH